ncbi:MAG: hypothetical protein M0Z28_18285 [Rhodospirillales bacterium]|nr:hypothetical protein [Rhodospirillales bacterium]
MQNDRPDTTTAERQAEAFAVAAGQERAALLRENERLRALVRHYAAQCGVDDSELQRVHRV